MAIRNLEIRMAHLEGACEQIDRRLGTIETDMRGLRADLVSGVDGLRARMDRQFFGMPGLLIVSILLPIAGSVGH